ncbi:hypothetical protein CC80DRAFT_489621 [Byssothecium circinans]|uniref:Xylanolytic transcriptional activator regulatory domain-containing protein n=1 Tax=Byssothecium circinans TaxID=147558 RepID=A0A6A5U3M1_9PLEO|nr:hypothetical protein CC80DRAFT_489621 [Byssothecium circinans]
MPVGDLSIEHLCPKAAFGAIIDDYLQLVFPLLPLVHRPSFRASIEAAAYTADPAFFRLCLAVCAVTVASIPRKFEEYGREKYADVGAMVDRACHMVLLSRIASEPEWQNQPQTGTMIVSILLTMASHYAGRANQGWGYASEAIQFFRALELYRKVGYEHLSLLEGEMCKRAFWLLYIIQIHDRLSFIVPHTGLSFDPLRTDWEFLLPYELDDEDLVAQNYAEVESINVFGSPSGNGPLPVISGFVALVKVFLCVVDLLSNGFPGSPPQVYAMTSGTLRTQIYPDNPVDGTLTGAGIAPSKSTISLSALLRIVRKLQSTLEELPPILKISNLDPQLQSSHSYPSMPSALTNQFDIMRANIHITSLYIQSSILEACSNAFTNPQTNSSSASSCDETRLSPIQTPRTQLWMFRKSIARELLEVLHFCSSRTLEANGSSMIVKIREIAATLLNNDLDVSSEEEEESRQYLAQFADILANLDYMGQSIIIPPVFSRQ